MNSIQDLRNKIEEAYQRDLKRLNEEHARDLKDIERLVGRFGVSTAQQIEPSRLTLQPPAPIPLSVLNSNLALADAVLRMSGEFTMRSVIETIGQTDPTFKAKLDANAAPLSTVIFRLKKQKKIVEITPKSGRGKAVYRVAGRDE